MSLNPPRMHLVYSASISASPSASPRRTASSKMSAMPQASRGLTRPRRLAMTVSTGYRAM